MERAAGVKAAEREKGRVSPRLRRRGLRFHPLLHQGSARPFVSSGQRPTLSADRRGNPPCHPISMARRQNWSDPSAEGGRRGWADARRLPPVPMRRPNPSALANRPKRKTKRPLPAFSRPPSEAARLCRLFGTSGRQIRV